MKAFIVVSDEYQLCLNKWMGAEQAAAERAGAEMDSNIKDERDRLGDANQLDMGAYRRSL